MRSAFARDSIGERLPFQILHDEEVDRVLTTDVVERADVRMIQRRDRARFTVEALATLRVASPRLRQDLDRHRAIQARGARPIYFPHAAPTKGRLNLIWAETGAWTEGHAG